MPSSCSRDSPPTALGDATTSASGARRLDLGESVSIAVAVVREFPFACDDVDGRLAYRVLGAREALRTVDLVKAATEASLLGPDEARAGYRELIESDLHRFGGPSWDSPSSNQEV